MSSRTLSSPESPRRPFDPLAWVDAMPPLITRKGAAGDICSERHIDRAIARGDLEVVRLGGKVLITRTSYRRWLSASLQAG